MDIKANILPYDDLVEIYRKNLKPCPYVVGKNNGNQRLVLIAAKHTNNPADSQFKVISSEWAKFIDKADKTKAVILTESGIRPDEESEEVAIKKYGEQGLLSHWAEREGIRLESPDLNRKQQTEELLREFSMEEIMHYYFVRQVPQWHQLQQSPKPGFGEYIQESLDSYKRELGWDFDFSLNNLAGIHKKITGNPFDHKDSKFSFHLSDPTKSEYKTQQVARASSELRDYYIAKRVVELWNKGCSMFGVYGSAHVYRLEPLIEVLGD